MSARPSAPVNSDAAVCGACHHENDSEAQYCAGCGHALFEPCGKCARTVALTQKFCGSCGFDLNQSLQQRRTKRQQRITRAAELAERQQFDEASSLLDRISSTNDYRFRDLSHSAGKTLAKVQRLKEETLAQSEQLMRRAKQAMKQSDRRTAIACLQQVPRRLLDQDSEEILKEIQRDAALKSALQEALEKKDWRRAGPQIEQLLEIEPDNPKYRKLVEQIAAKLLKTADKHFASRNYDAAIECADAIPWVGVDKRHRSIRQKMETVRWFSHQFQGEPFATSTLAWLAGRFAKEVPKDEQAAQLAKELAAGVKTQPDRPRAAWPTWRAHANSWLGGKVNLFAAPQSIDARGDRPFWKRPGRFCVAIGLALQGLGIGRIQDNFAPKKSVLFSPLATRRRNSCWGIDIGASGIHAVLLRKEKGDPKPVVVQTYAADFETLTCRQPGEDQAPQTIQSAIRTMLATIDLGDWPVYVNLPARVLISRFLCLPPVKDKQAEHLLDEEIEHQIPIPVGELEVVRWAAAVGENTQRGRPALISAAKKTAVAEHLQLFAATGLNPTGLQADPLALVNFIAHEFSDRLGDPAEPLWGTDPAPSVAMIDAGASKTALVVVSREACWFRTVETGGEDFTSLLARSTKTIASEAEKFKRNPANLPRPAEAFAPVETKQEELRGRLMQMFEEGKRKHDRFDVVESWCVGGAPLIHGWMRRVTLV